MPEFEKGVAVACGPGGRKAGDKILNFFGCHIVISILM
jgi:hypothetical protein